MLSRLLISLFLLCTATLAANRPTPGGTSHAAPTADLPLIVSPSGITWPTFGHSATQKNIAVSLENEGNATLTFSAIELHEDSTKPSPLPSGWLGFTGATAGTVINAGATLATTLQLNKSGVITGSPRQLWGHIMFRYGWSMGTGSLVFRIQYTVADTVVFLKWDTLSTACTQLTVANNGNMGHARIGGANMNFVPPLECDIGSNSRGNADIYLRDGSPVIVRTTGTSYAASWSIFGDSLLSVNSFTPIAKSQPVWATDPDFDFRRSGTFCSSDSLVKVEKVWFAPKGMQDSCKFIIEKTMFFPYTIDQPVTGLAIGEAVDWDVPSDSNRTWNLGWYDPSRNLLFMRGYNKVDDTIDCRNNNVRFAGLGLLSSRLKDSAYTTALWAGYNDPNDSFVDPAGKFLPEEMWANMKRGGYWSDLRVTDLHSILVYRNTEAQDQGWTLPANDTLTVWSVLITIPNATSSSAGVDSLKAQYDRAKAFYLQHLTCYAGLFGGCCNEGTRGNVNQTGIIDISDVSLLIAYLTSSPPPTLPCKSAANVDASPDGMIDISDLSRLVGWIILVPHPNLPPCGCL